MWKLIVAVLVSLFLQKALASQNEADYGECNNLAVSQQVFDCSRERAGAADVKLNEIYKELMEEVIKAYSSNSRLGKDLRNRLRASQRAWLASRDANCLLEVFVVE